MHYLLVAQPPVSRLESVPEGERSQENGDWLRSAAEVPVPIFLAQRRLSESASDRFPRALHLLGQTLTGRDDLAVTFETSIDMVRDDLAGPRPTPLGIVLAERAALCWYDTQGKGRVTKCDNMRGAQVRDTDFRSVQLCGKPLERRGCVRVGAHTLRRYTGSKLEGAIVSKG